MIVRLVTTTLDSFSKAVFQIGGIRALDLFLDFKAFTKLLTYALRHNYKVSYLPKGA